MGCFDDPWICVSHVQEADIGILQQVIKIEYPVTAPFIFLNEGSCPALDWPFPLWGIGQPIA